MADADAPHPPQGAILNDEQIRKLRIGVVVMSVILVAGIITLIGRIIYLANRGEGQATPGAVTPPRAVLAAETRLVLPSGATLKSTTLTGDRLVTQYTSPTGDGLMILDLVTGKTLSHVRIQAAP